MIYNAFRYSKLGDDLVCKGVLGVDGQAFLNYIDGKWVPAKSGKTLASHNPATGELIGTVPDSDREDVARAVDAAARAFDKWRKTPAPRRADILHNAADLIRARKEELGELLTREMGKVLPEALGDVQEAVDMGMYMAGEGRRLNGLLVPSELDRKSTRL